ncbi:hypothetical protein EMIHUDRAFT_463915 [Emiliania huxleyi CCMP1516]|uniref:6-phosphofructo-2-kinase domain-containing protein n=2 Tax=Emiliania huxleyi TaxID=2903 RepID=A0A0D3JAS8_EMIH1|nr:hypothetical protein EMIHUDRAFT_463915 [Emiliania huxleyi CCMP1516]EOD20613.1 hypothetical protein EMIHUDRAFT_463915 [Emiliania huxleyi CCMP1516]|eukprot:XP_005773042.1 hypothetical protein EMIHUDRAFT_463915 [Emiliania huxleyi CCMP1516]
MMQSEPEQLHKVPSRSNSDGDSKRGLLRRAPTFRAPERMLTQNSYTVFQERVVIAMVGLPARGKSYISKAIVRYLNFLGCPTQLFNAGSLRRKQGLAGTDASFFDPSNKSAQAQKEQMAMDCLDELLDWLQEQTVTGGCACGILDATNTTIERRAKVIERCTREREEDGGLRLIFVESITEDEAILSNNFRMKFRMKVDNDDYSGTDPEAALADFKARVRQYEKVYQPVGESEGDGATADHSAHSTLPNPMFDAGRKLESKLVKGEVERKAIWLVLVGETRNACAGVLGGDSSLTAAGSEYARATAELLVRREHEIGGTPAAVICGTLKRYALCEATEPQPPGERCPNCKRRGCDSGCEGADRRCFIKAAANELCAGFLDSLTQAEIRSKFPREAAARQADALTEQADKLTYRYPGAGGESYADVVLRMNDIICMLESSVGNAVVICDRAVYRVIQAHSWSYTRAYFDGTPIEEMPNLEVKPGVLEFRRSHSGFSTTHLEVSSGAATNVSGPGSKPRLLPGSLSPRLSDEGNGDTKHWPLAEGQQRDMVEALKVAL